MVLPAPLRGCAALLALLALLAALACLAPTETIVKPKPPTANLLNHANHTKHATPCSQTQNACPPPSEYARTCVTWRPLNPLSARELEPWLPPMRLSLRAPARQLQCVSAALAVSSWPPRLACPRERSLHDLVGGGCLCRTGYTGEDCSKVEPQKCNDPRSEVEAGRDYDWTRVLSRCAGSCDTISNRCLCGSRARYPRRHMRMCEFRNVGSIMPWLDPGWAHFRILEPWQLWSSPNTTPPELERRVGAQKLGELWARRPRTSALSTQDEAWCDRDIGRPVRSSCSCYEDGGGPTCDEPVLAFCLNQCSGRGRCVRGFCVCDTGWSGTDCSAELPAPPSRAPASPAAKPVERRRPAIYVYELPARFNTWTLETRQHSDDCVYRRYLHGNETKWENYAFGLELALHEALLASPHRTLNPEDADYFYVPVYGGCYISRFTRPTPRHNLALYPGMGSTVLGSQHYRDALHWIRQNHRYWDRAGGADHLFSFAHDEGACVAPVELANATLLSAWGRTQLYPNSSTDNPSQNWYRSKHRDTFYGSRRCHDPAKDIVVPAFASMSQVANSPYLAAGEAVAAELERPRKLLFHWRGQVVHSRVYSMGIRQQVLALFGGRESEGIIVSDRHSPSFLEEILNSTFCGVFPGNGWGHVETPIMHGCIPVVVQDGILAPW